MECNMQEILTMLKYSMLAYKSPQFCSDKELIYYTSVGSDVQYCYKIKDDTLIVSFRGTDSLTDVITDFKFWKRVVPYDNSVSNIRVHYGFVNTYKIVDVRMKIQSLVTQNIKNVKITGHSYGAALAVLCAVDLQYNFPNINYQVVVFGCPRVGNLLFERSYDKRVPNTYRVVNSNDLVTKIPFKSMGYAHVGKMLHIGFPNLPLVFSFQDHQVIEYIRWLWNKTYISS